MTNPSTSFRNGLLAAGLLLGPLLTRAQSWQSAFALPVASGGSLLVSEVRADGAGGSVATGTFTGTMTLGSFTLTSAGGSDVFVARFNSAGVCTQAVRAGGPNYERAAAISLDGTGLVTLLGEFDSPTIAFGATTLTNAATGTNSGLSTDVFVARLTAAGQWSQAVQAGGAFGDSAGGLAAGPNGSMVAVGSFTGGRASFGNLALNSPSTSRALFVARLSSAGVWTQAVTSYSPSPNSASCVAVKPSGEAIVGGSFFGALPVGTLTLGNFTLSTTASFTLFVGRLSAAGSWTQAAQANNVSGNLYPSALALDAGGNAVVAGNFRNANALFGSFVLSYSGPTNGQGADQPPWDGASKFFCLGA